MPSTTDLASVLSLLRRLLEEATPGPWTVVREDGGAICIEAPDGQDMPWSIALIEPHAPGHDDDGENMNNASLIVAAVTALPQLLAAVEQMRAQIDAANNEDGTSVDDAPIHLGNDAASAWVEGYEAGQDSICQHLTQPKET